MPFNKSISSFLAIVVSFLWSNIQSITSVVAIVVTLIIANMSANQNEISLGIQKQMLKNQITIEQINYKQSHLSDKYYLLINKIESNPEINISDVVSSYVMHVQHPHRLTQYEVTELRDILYDCDQLAYDILDGHYSVDIALPILTGFFARVEAAISSVSKEDQMIIRKGMPHYTYLLVEHGVPYMDKKIKVLKQRSKELEKCSWGYDPSLRFYENSTILLDSSANTVSLDEFANELGGHLTYHAKGKYGVELAVFDGARGVSVVLLEGKVVAVLYRYQLHRNYNTSSVHQVAMEIHSKCMGLPKKWILSKEPNMLNGQLLNIWSNCDWVATDLDASATYIFEKEYGKNFPYADYVAGLLRGDEKAEVVIYEDELSKEFKKLFQDEFQKEAN